MASPEGQSEALLNKLVAISGVSVKIVFALLDQFPACETIQVASAEKLTKIPKIGP